MSSLAIGASLPPSRPRPEDGRQVSQLPSVASTLDFVGRVEGVAGGEVIAADGDVAERHTPDEGRTHQEGQRTGDPCGPDRPADLAHPGGASSTSGPTSTG